MKAEQPISKADRLEINLKMGARVTLVVLLLSFVRHLVAFFEIRYQLMSPLIPDRTIWEISKQFLFHAIVFALAALAGLVLYYFDKYLLIIILAILIFIANAYIYV
jgi:hypothetical protein